jgi:PAS domain S-box-containing protein
VAALADVEYDSIKMVDEPIEHARALAEARLAASERKFAAIFETAPFAITLIKMPSTTIVEVNPAFIRIFGYARDELIGRTSVELGMHNDLEARERVRHELETKGHVRNIESRVRTKRGELLVIDNNLDPVELDGQPYILGTFQDVTAERRAEQALKETAERLAEALRVRDDFLAIAGHELRTPLAALLLRVQGLERSAHKEGAPPRLREQLKRASSAGDRLARLIEEVLDVARLASGKLKLELERVNLIELVRGVIERAAESAQVAHTPIVLRAEPPDPIGSWDRLQLERVVSNLLSNALKYGKGHPIEIELGLAGDEAVMRVVDHGIGIPLAEQERIFERFERAVATREYGGLGLGLWISRQIVEASGGRIAVVSAPGQGATFTVRLPLRP